MATALFISPSQIKAETNIDENVDEKTLRESIIFCQGEYTKAVVGTALYDEIAGQIVAGTMTALNTTLRDTYLRPALRYWVVYEAMDELHTKIMNKSVMNKRSENSDPVDLNTILALKSKYRNRAERLDQQAINYLRENSDSYPLYLNPGSGVDTVQPKNTSYNTGWYLGTEGTNYGLETDCGSDCE